MPLPWFRRKQRQSAATIATPFTELAPEELPLGEKEAPSSPTLTAEPEPGEQAAKSNRRRGSRGGRNRRKPTNAPATAEAPKREQRAPAKAEKAPKDGKSAADRRRSSPSRRRQVSRRAPLPAAKRELLVSVDVTEKRVAVLEDGRVAEVYLERPERRSIAGNIYKGVVDNVLPGMEAAFVEIGLEKNGFLFVDEIVGPELEGRRPRGRRITDLISRGEQVLVQAVKDPMKTKGARLTTEISLPGRFVVFVPHGEGLGVSRRLEEDERNRLRDIVKEIAPKQGGVIVRTAAEGASADDVRLDLEFLMKLWKQIQTHAKESQPPSLVFEEAELPLRVTRDLFTGDFERAMVDDDRTLKRIQGYLKKTSPHMAERVSRYRDKVPLFEAFGVEAEIRSTLSRRVDLPSGGYLIFDYAEAFTVIDVNTGRFVGSRSKSSGARLEDTVTKNNLEAVKEVVRQLRLRDIGGIIVIDFIDMANPKNREAVEQALQLELERDRTKTYVVEISPLGLVEMTRQNVTDGPREILTRKCPTCAGEGVVVSEATAVVDAERRLRALVACEATHEGVQGGAERARGGAADRARSRPLAGDRGLDEAPPVRDREEQRSARAFRGARGGHGREAGAGRPASRRRADGRAQARRGGTARCRLCGREGRRDVRRRRRSGQARRQEGLRARRARARRSRVRDACRRRGRGGRIRADHGGGPGREADARLSGEKAGSACDRAPKPSPSRKQSPSAELPRPSSSPSSSRWPTKRASPRRPACRPRRRPRRSPAGGLVVAGIAGRSRP